MSLINQMLKDLDARGAQGGAPLPADIKTVLREGRALPLPVVARGILAAAVLAVAAVFGWRWWSKPLAAPAAVALAVPLAVPGAIPATVPAVVQGASAPLPAQVAAPLPASAPAPLPAPVPARTAVAPAPDKPAKAQQPDTPPLPERQGAEDAYRRALDQLQEGRVGDAVDQLEGALRRDPRHEAARQTLAGLLLENGRAADAMRVLESGLALDAAQPAAAMLLARLQIDGGASGVETLLRTLPSAQDNAAYRAFLAAALQREARHGEAAQHYAAALRLVPENGVWMMGLGMSLLADKREAEALDAFQRARASGVLPPGLQAFVDRKIAQLTR